MFFSRATTLTVGQCQFIEQLTPPPHLPPPLLTIAVGAITTGSPNIPDARERQLLREKELPGSAEEPKRLERVRLRSDKPVVVLVVVIGTAAAVAVATTAAVAAVGFPAVPTRGSGGGRGPTIP